MKPIIRIYYEPQETGPAELLGNRLARIVDPPLLTDEFFQGDIVLLDRDADDTERGYPWIEEIVVRRHAERTCLSYSNEIEFYSLSAVFAILGAECRSLLPPGEDRPGTMIVGHASQIDPVALAEAVGITQPLDEYDTPPVDDESIQPHPEFSVTKSSDRQSTTRH